MKNSFKVMIIALIAVIGFSMAACGDGSGDGAGNGQGYITITDIPSEYNGMRLSFMIDPRSDNSLIESKYEGGNVISNNKFVAPLVRKPYRLGTEEEPYRGNEIIVSGSEKALINGYEYKLRIQIVILPVNFQGSYPNSAYTYFRIIAFKNGNAALSFNERGLNERANTLAITNISQTQANQGKNGISVGIFPAGTTLQQALTRTGIVAGAEDALVSINGSSAPFVAAASLFAGPAFTNEWAGSGTYDIYLAFGSAYYRKQNVTFTSAAVTSIDAATFSTVTQ